MMFKSRLGNKSAFLCADLILIANKIDQKTLVLAFFPDFSMVTTQK